MRKQFFNLGHLGLVFSCFVIFSCSGSNTTDVDAGTDGTDGGDDGGVSLPWPDTTLEMEGVQPSIALGGDGMLVLAFEHEGKVWVLQDPVSGTKPVAVEESAGESTWVRAVGAPEDDSVLVAWSYARGVWVDEAGPGLPSDKMVDSFEVGDRVGLAWSMDGPLLLLDDKSGTHVLLVKESGPAPAPVPDDLLIAPNAGTGFHYFNEIPTVADLGSGDVLAFALLGEENDSGYGTKARWVIGQRVQNGEYYRPRDSGTLDLPGGREQNHFWIQVHRLDADRWILSWAQVSPGSQVFDVFLSKLGFGQDGVPELEGDAVNISNTPGETDNSDHPLVLPAGDHRIWVAWREINFGPRVALLDNDLKMLAITAPDDELDLDESQPISAAVDKNGTLHLVAVVRPDGDAKIRYWQFELPD